MSQVYKVWYYVKWCNSLFAVKRRYESLRRQYLDEENENFEEIHASKGKIKKTGM